MTLDSWRIAQQLSFAELGRRLGCSRTQSLRLCRGDRTPDREMMRRVGELTGGAVTPNDFFAEAVAPAPLQPEAGTANA
ncbi:MAG: helix-turn-helix transcriptional regulator [Azospirillum sp.]|nr:helix-turn-helix transcriptional regulator [Azospirillum sp.]